MYSKPSRSELRNAKLQSLAEEGVMICTCFSLFKGEEMNLRKKGFYVVRTGLNERKALPATISCEYAFKSGIPLIVYNYIHGIIETFPSDAIKNEAQKLYVIAARAKYAKARKKS